MRAERIFNTAVGATIKRWRKQKGLKQSELAERASSVTLGGYTLGPISEATIGNIERATVAAHLADLVRICIVLGKSLQELIDEVEKTLEAVDAYLQAKSALYGDDHDTSDAP